MAAEQRVRDYLPNDTPPFGQLVLLGFQHILTMFPATVFVAAFTGFHVGTMLLASGVFDFSELCAFFGISRKTGYGWVGRLEGQCRAGGKTGRTLLARAPTGCGRTWRPCC